MVNVSLYIVNSKLGFGTLVSYKYVCVSVIYIIDTQIKIIQLFFSMTKNIASVIGAKASTTAVVSKYLQESSRTKTSLVYNKNLSFIFRESHAL